MSQTEIEQPSERELELLHLLSQGLSNREIAQELHISPNTVKVHLRNIYAKLNVRSRTEATMVAIQSGWVKLGIPETPAPEPETPESVSPQVVRDAVPVSAPVAPPLARWKRVYMLIAALAIALGVWVTRPRPLKPLPVPDTPTPARQPPALSGDRWKTLPPMPTPRSKLAVVYDNHRIFAIAGVTADGVSDAVEIYYIQTNTWVSGAPQITAVSNVQAVSLRGKILLPGGMLSDDTVTNTLQVYDPNDGALGSWRAAQSMPQAACAYAATAYAGDLYLFGGWDGRAPLAGSYRYDPQQDRWAELAGMLTPRGYGAAVTLNDHIYVVGGYDGESELATCEVYDPNADEWAACPSMNSPRGGIGAVEINGKMHIVGGGLGSSFVLDNEIFTPADANPAQGVWQGFKSPFLQEWYEMGVATDGVTLYALGGWHDGILDVNKAYRALYVLYIPGVTGQ